MSRLVRMTYGHGGSRLNRIQVCTGPGNSSPDPLWLRLLLVVVCIAIPLLVCRFAVPTAPHQAALIDVGQLALQVYEPPPSALRESPPAHQIEAPVPPPEPAPLERAAAAPPEDVRHPTITRTSGPRLPEPEEISPRITRQRLQAAPEPSGSSALPIRRAATPDNVAAPPGSRIIRTRQSPTADTGAGSERPVRRAQVTESLPQETPAAGRPVRNRANSADTGLTENPARPPSPRARAQAASAEEGTTTPQLARGVSLMSLGICAGSQQEEEKIKSVLSVVGSQDNCTNDKGTFEFRGTTRISSFNLIIYPGKGRKPSNRCEELKHAYDCLKTR